MLKRHLNKFMNNICPPCPNDVWLYFSCLIALIPVFYSIFDGMISYMTLNFLFGLAIFVYLVWRLITKLIQKEKIEFTRNPLVYFFALFIFLIFLGAFFSIDIKASWFGMTNDGHTRESVWQFIFYFLFGVVAYNLNSNNKKWILSLIILLSCFYVILGFCDPYGKVIAGFSSNSYKYSLMFFNPNHSAYLICATAMLAGGKMVYANKLSQKILWGACYFIQSVFLIMNSSTGPILALIISLVGFVIYIFFYDSRKINTTGILVFLFVVSWLLIDFTLKIAVQKREPYYLQEQIIQPFFAIFGREMVFTKIDGKGISVVLQNENIVERLEMWKKCFANMMDRPLLGTGVGTFKTANPEFGLTNPHNEILQYGATFGIPAMISYLAGILGVFLFITKNKKNKNEWAIISGFSVFCYFISSLFGATIPGVLAVFSLILGISVKGAIGTKN